jgi:hypothetical protein
MYAELDRPDVLKPVERQEETGIKVGAVGRERVDLVRAVAPARDPRRRASCRLAPDANHVAFEWCPLALDANESWSQIEDEVVALAFAERSQDTDTATEGLERDR